MNIIVNAKTSNFLKENINNEIIIEIIIALKNANISIKF